MSQSAQREIDRLDMEISRLGRAREELLAVLHEIVHQTYYVGFGDPASRAAYVEQVARDAIRKAGEA